MTRYYLAAAFARKNELRGYRDELVRRGHVVTSRWLDEADGRTFPNCDPGDMVDCAVKAEEDIDGCDTIIRFSDGRDVKMAGDGRMVEWGYARSLLKEMILIGPVQHPWDWLDSVRRFPSWSTFLATVPNTADCPMNIAFVGPMGSGKTTAAKLLVARHGFVRMALADPVKDDAASMLSSRCFGLPVHREDIDNNKAVFRPFLQWLGTDYVREYLGMPTHWIDRLLAKVKTVDDPVVVDDIRFRNEAAALRAVGFRLVRVWRPAADCPRSDTLSHPSETEQDDIIADDTIHNDGSLGDLAEAVDHLVAR